MTGETSIQCAWGKAPTDVYWQLGVRHGTPPLLTYVGDRIWREPAPAGAGLLTDAGA